MSIGAIEGRDYCEDRRHQRVLKGGNGCAGEDMSACPCDGDCLKGIRHVHSGQRVMGINLGAVSTSGRRMCEHLRVGKTEMLSKSCSVNLKGTDHVDGLRCYRALIASAAVGIQIIFESRYGISSMGPPVGINC